MNRAEAIERVRQVLADHDDRVEVAVAGPDARWVQTMLDELTDDLAHWLPTVQYERSKFRIKVGMPGPDRMHHVHGLSLAAPDHFRGPLFHLAWVDSDPERDRDGWVSMNSYLSLRAGLRMGAAELVLSGGLTVPTNDDLDRWSRTGH